LCLSWSSLSLFGSFGEPELRDRDWQAQSALGSSTYPD
jgi:hypothetical protein